MKIRHIVMAADEHFICAETPEWTLSMLTTRGMPEEVLASADYDTRKAHRLLQRAARKRAIADAMCNPTQE